MQPEFLEIHSVSHSFGDERVLDKVSAKIPVGHLLALLGPSGCGKTTLLRIVAGLTMPDEGDVFYRGVSLRSDTHNGKVGYAFQAPTLLPWRTALQNVLLPAELLGQRTHGAGKEHAQRVLELVGLGEDTAKYPSQLSGGMQQRVGLARALVNRPSLMLLDEPFGALDGITRDRLNETVRAVWLEYKMTILFVTHSIEEAVYLADDVMVLSQKPARVLDTVPIDLDRERPITVRAKSEFFHYAKRIREITEGSQ